MIEATEHARKCMWWCLRRPKGRQAGVAREKRGKAAFSESEGVRGWAFALF